MASSYAVNKVKLTFNVDQNFKVTKKTSKDVSIEADSMKYCDSGELQINFDRVL